MNDVQMKRKEFMGAVGAIVTIFLILICLTINATEEGEKIIEKAKMGAQPATSQVLRDAHKKCVSLPEMIGGNLPVSNAEVERLVEICERNKDMAKIVDAQRHALDDFRSFKREEKK